MSGPPPLLDYLDEPDLDRFAEVVADLLIAGARRIAPPADSVTTEPAQPPPLPHKRHRQRRHPKATDMKRPPATS
jgi:hypothetical protein